MIPERAQVSAHNKGANLGHPLCSEYQLQVGEELAHALQAAIQFLV